MLDHVYNGIFVFKQHCQRVGARITLYCSIIQITEVGCVRNHILHQYMYLAF